MFTMGVGEKMVFNGREKSVNSKKFEIYIFLA